MDKKPTHRSTSCGNLRRPHRIKTTTVWCCLLLRVAAFLASAYTGRPCTSFVVERVPPQGAPYMGAQRYQADRNCYDFRTSEQCRMAIEGCSPNFAQGADRLFYLSENIALLHRRHNDLVHEANRAQYRLQQSWNMLSEAYTVLFADIEALG